MLRLNLSILNKISIIVLVPFLLILYFSILDINEKLQVLDEVNDIEQLSLLSVKLSSLIHETQKERGATGVYMGGDGIGFKTELDKQRKLTDLKRANFDYFVNNFNSELFGSEFKLSYDSMLTHLGKLDEHRIHVDNLGTTDQEGIDYYTQLNAKMLDVIGHISKLSTNAHVSTLIASYVNFLKAKEKAGIERAVGSVFFAADKFSKGQLEYYNSLIVSQDTFFSVFATFATNEHYDLFLKKMSEQVVTDVQKMRDTATKSETEDELLSDLWIQMGYGGAIYNFKNYILRGEQKYIDKFNSEYKETIKIINELNSLETSNNYKKTRLKIVRETFDAYDNNLKVAMVMKEEGATISEIDFLVKIDDAPALSALNGLIEFENFNLDATLWFRLMTEKINLLKDVEDKIASDLQFSVRDIREKAVMSLYFSIALIFLIVFIGFLTFYLSRSITRPILKLKEDAQLIGKGKFGIKIDTSASDEIGDLAKSFKGMKEDLQTSSDKLLKAHKLLEYEKKSVEEKVVRRTKELTDAKSEIEKILKQKIEFINQLSHDLRTPLVPIMSLLPIAIKNIKNKSIKKDIEISLRNAKYLKGLVTETLSLARLDSGTVEFYYSKTNIKKLIDDILIDNKTIFINAKIQATSKIKNNVYVLCDALRIREVIQNLHSNAIKFMPDGGKLRIDCKKRVDDVIIFIKDTGLGVNKSDIDKIFNEFYKSDKSRHNMTNLGLGLAICQRIIEKHNGKIWAESKGSGKGTTISFTLPLYQKA